MLNDRCQLTDQAMPTVMSNHQSSIMRRLIGVQALCSSKSFPSGQGLRTACIWGDSYTATLEVAGIDTTKSCD
jgi:hypothetical protein